MVVSLNLILLKGKLDGILNIKMSIRIMLQYTQLKISTKVEEEEEEEEHE